VIAPIMTEPGGRAWRQTIFHPFALTARWARGTVLRLELDSPTYETERFGEVPVLDAVATHEPDTGEVVLFVVNRDVSEPLDLQVDMTAFGDLQVIETWTVGGGADPYARNTADQPDRVRPVHLDVTVLDRNLSTRLPPVSWNAIRLTSADPDKVPVFGTASGQLLRD